MKVKIKRVYEPASQDDGYRVLVDRLWPRGIKKEHIDKWLKEVAPSNELRKWYNHDTAKWKEFTKKYHAEIKDSDALEELRADIRQHKTVTLLYGSKNEERNQAVALQHFLAKTKL